MSPTLYIFEASPPARAVIMLAKHLGIELQIKVLDFMTKEHQGPEFSKINPTHTVPALVDDDGFVLWESHAIMIYLVEKYSKDDSLYPKELRKRAIVNQRLYFEADIIFNRFAAIARGFLRKTKTSLEPFDYEQINDVYAFLQEFLNKTKWMADDSLTIVDYSILSTVSSLNLIIPIETEKYPKLIDWLNRMDALPSTAVDRDGLAAFNGFAKAFIKV